MKRSFGWTGVEVPVVGLGTWQMESDDAASAVKALRRGVDLGLTHVDTAELYGMGRVEEEIVAKAIAGRRDEIFLVSKVMPVNASRKGTIAACETSLKKLRTDRLDCYLLHWAGEHPLEETIAAFQELVAAGKLLRWGVSNFDVPELEAALAIAGENEIACNQVRYDVQERHIEHAVLPWCRKHRVAMVGYSPFGSRGGFPKPGSAGGKVLAELAEKRGVSPRAIVLAFLVREEGTFTIPKSSQPAHVEELAGALDLTLTKAEIAAIDAAFPRGKPKRELPTI